ncbi:uncharacterized protein LOC141641410 [Silene latifolia]|uniref:uncharacterized protein LOC141641410 n=1 Tax=Silene latifolia TaxID=37657 RepID=UPI003D77F305
MGGDEIHTSCESEEDHIPGKRKKKIIPVVDDKSDFSKLRWCVGIRFPNREVFRDCVTRYAIAQGRNLTFEKSHKARGQRLGVRCVSGCPFKMYASWDNQSACMLVKSVDPYHACHRNMESNRQLTSTWLAKQFLEVFKERPHWPASEIIETLKGEKNDSYEWFFKELKKTLGEKNGDGWTILSNQHPSILTMVAKELPKAEHRHCARHIFANWHKSYKGDEIKLCFWNCAKAYNQAGFDEALDAMREVDHKAAEAFLACNPTLFCKSFINTTTKTDVIVNNMAETFNAYIIEVIAKHLIYMLEDIRSAMMQRLVLKKAEMEKKQLIVCPRVQQRFEEEKDKTASYQVLPSSTRLFQVKHGIDELKVDLVTKTCTCRKWDLIGISCSHAIATIFNIHRQAENYVHDMYKKEAYLKAYSGSISPCLGHRHWPKATVGLGVLFDDQGNAYTNAPGNNGPVSLNYVQRPSTQPTQASVNQ